MRRLERILHVDDVPAIQLVTRIALERIGGFQVLSCSTGREALERLDDFAPNLILLDVMLPGMDGPELLRQLHTRLNLREVAVVFLTGHPEPEQREQLFRLGAWNVLEKPFDPMRLPDRLQAIWQAGPDAPTAGSRSP